MESNSYIRNETWPPAYPNPDLEEMAFEIFLRETKATLTFENPNHAALIAKTHGGHLLMEFLDNPQKNPPLILGHGLILTNEIETFPLIVDTEKITSFVLEEIKPGLRVHIGRALVWNYIYESLAKDQAGPEEEDEDEPTASFDIPELSGWTPKTEREIIPHTHPLYAEFVQTRPQLQELFHAILKAEVRYPD